ncbi:MAG: VacJ family lipoprotein [Proteobacteria bacterium]|nr:MAG: VacJ family lipoprotein [Pseudomonadota bacterium]QKK11738.1 MAG: VacJ family lipoprotein [Pseudomonadota bacterium]
MRFIRGLGKDRDDRADGFANDTPRRSWVVIALSVLIASGCASLPGERDPKDPFESFNRSMYKFNDALDRAVLKPVAEGYVAITPDPVNKGVTNIFSNLEDVWVTANDVLQFKFGQALSDLWRLVINSTFGIYGIFDVATPLGLNKHHEDFGQTLGHWGVGPGPYLVWPVLGPSTIRDTTGDVVEASQWRAFEEVSDSTAGENTLFILDTIDTRADLLGASRVMSKVALDPYIFLRESYLQKRRALVYDGNPPDDDFFDIDKDEDDPKAARE